MRILIALLLYLAFLPSLALANVSQEEQEALEAMLNESQRMFYQSLPPAQQTEFLERMRTLLPEQRTRRLESFGKRRMTHNLDQVQGLEDGLNRLPAHQQEQLRNALMEHADEIESEEFAPIDESELAEGSMVLKDSCDGYSRYEREAMCADYKRKLAASQQLQPQPFGAETGVEGAQDIGSNAATGDRYRNLLAQRQQQAAAFGTRRMLEACGCGEFEMDKASSSSPW